MLCPVIVSENPLYVKDSGAVFVLELSLEDPAFERLKRELETIEGDTLLFTRKLLEITVMFSETILVSHSYECIDDDVVSITTIRGSQSTESKYVLHTCEGKMVPHEERPYDVTKITIAFPFDSTGAVIENQNIFVTLPLNRTAFSVSSHSIYVIFSFSSMQIS